MSQRQSIESRLNQSPVSGEISDVTTKSKHLYRSCFDHINDLFFLSEQELGFESQ